MRFGSKRLRTTQQLWLCILTLQESFRGINSLQTPSQGLATTTITKVHSQTTLTLQASSEEYVDKLFNADDFYSLDNSPLQDSLKAVRESMNSIQESIDATKQSLEEASISSSCSASKSIASITTIPDASSSSSSLPSHTSGAVQEVIAAAASSSSSNPTTETVELNDATQIWKDVMAQLQTNHYLASPFGGNNDDYQNYYFPSSSVDSMRDSLNSIQQSIQEGRAIHNPMLLLLATTTTTTTTSTNVNVNPLPSNVISDTAATTVAAATTTSTDNRVPTLMEYLLGKRGGTASDFQSHQLSPSSIEVSSGGNNQGWKEASQFLEHTASSSNSFDILSNAKIKLSMMVYNAYLLVGLEPPENCVKSGATITPSVGLIASLFALLWAMGSKQMARSHAEESMKAIILEYQQQQATLKSQLVPLTIEVSRLNGQVAELKEELYATNFQLERLEFKASLEREFWATKLKAKRRRIHRMRQSLVHKKAQLEDGTWQQKERLELTRQHNRALEALSKNGKIVFDESLKVVSFLRDTLSKQQQLNQIRMEDQRLQDALKAVDVDMNHDSKQQQLQQLHQTKLEDQRLQDALREVEAMDFEVNGSSTNSTSTSTVPLYYATTEMSKP